MPYYANINEDKKVVGISKLKTEISDPNCIPIENYNELLIGKKYNSVTGEFESISTEPNSIISGINLWDRFEEAEQENLVDSANKKIKRFLYELRIRSSFDLKDPKLINAINALETATIIGIGRAAEILSY